MELEHIAGLTQTLISYMCTKAQSIPPPTLFIFQALCDFADRYSGELQNNAILLWKQSMLQAEFKLIFLYEQQGLVCNPTKYLSLTLNLHLENL